MGFIDVLFGFKVDGNIYVLGSIYSLVILIPSIAVFVRRLHDINKSGWYFIPFFVGVVVVTTLLIAVVSLNAYILYYIVLFFKEYVVFAYVVAIICGLSIGSTIYFLRLICKKGDKGSNQYGEDPKAIVIEG